MKKRLWSFIFVFCMLCVLLPNSVMASSESDLINKLKGSVSGEFVRTYYDDFDGDGQYEMFAFVGKLSHDDIYRMDIFVGDVWFVSDQATKKLVTEEGGMGIVLSYEEQPSYINTDKNKLFSYRHIWGNGQTATIVCAVKNKDVTTTRISGSLTNDANGLNVYSSQYDWVIEKSDFYSGEYFGMGRTGKQYWYYIDEVTGELKEYGGTEITKEQFCEFEGAADILNLITEGQIYNILYRSNGIININIIKDTSMFDENDAYECSNILVGYDNNSVWTIDTDFFKYELPFRSGFYLPALSKDIAAYPVFKSPKEIKVILNGTELDFDQPPTMDPAGRVLVPIRKIAEAMGDTVNWNQDMLTAFVAHNERALIIPLYRDCLYIAYSDKPIEWKTYSLDVPSQQQNNRTLTPVRAFCESLGADVTWDSSTQTVYIEYNDDYGNSSLSDETIKGINMAYSILCENSNVLFNRYTEEINSFLDGRNGTLDKIAITWNDGPFDGVVKLISGDDATEDAMKVALSGIINMLTKINEEEGKEVVDGVAFTKSNLEFINTLATLPKEDLVINKAEDLKKLSKTVPELESLSKQLKTFELFAMGTQELCFWLANYADNVKYLNSIEECLKSAGVENEKIYNIINEMRDEYTQKWLHSLGTVRDEGVEFVLSKFADLGTAGVFSIATFTKDVVNKLTGLDAKVEALYKFYGVCCLNPYFDFAYEKMCDNIVNDQFSGEQAIDMHDIQRATKATAYISMNEIINKPEEVSWNDRLDELQNTTYLMWK